MDYCDKLINSIRKLNTVILQAYYMKGSTNLTKMASLYFFREVQDAMRNTPIILSEMPYAMMIVLKISNVDIKQFLSLYQSKNFFVKHLRSGKVNYSGTLHHDKHFSKVTRGLEIWFDKRLKDNCPNCGMDIEEKMSGYSRELDIGFSLSFPITVDASCSSSSANSRTVDFRMVYMAGYSKNARGIISFPIISGPSLEWCTNDNGGDEDYSSSSSSSSSSSNNNNSENTSSSSISNNNGIHKHNVEDVKKEYSFSKMCCLLHYLWTREITGEMLNSNSCYVRLLSINPSNTHNVNIHNSRYFTIKNMYKNVGCNRSNSSDSVYVQEFASKVKVILLL
uniref:Wsv267-like protein n=1 Tax=Penaeus monodon majanivirus B TaxID=2984272 RepID=A0A9C7C7P8_9VIRU|nr:MAG: wsv267-like protein [Penaeus monodon majanivirus B]